jgi:hypothetical protein
MFVQPLGNVALEAEGVGHGPGLAVVNLLDNNLSRVHCPISKSLCCHLPKLLLDR